MRALTNIEAIFLRELTAFFLSPVAYIVIFLFVFANGLLFFFDCLGHADHPQQITLVLQSRFSFAVFLAIPISPLLTMRLFAEEKRSGSIELLMTTPVTETQVVLGKFFATQFFYMLIWSTLLLFVAILEVLGQSGPHQPSGPDWGTVWSFYTGLFFLGLLTNSLGILASTLSNNQLVAAVLALCGTLAFFVVHVGIWIFYDSIEFQRLFEFLSVNAHFTHDYSRGIVDLRYLAYCASLMLIFLFFSIRAVEARKHR